MTNRMDYSKARMLAVLAHPDDETFGMGGTLALYAQWGADVRLLCATRGEVGEAPPGLKGFASIGEMREAELRCASGILGLSHVEFLGYRDSGMPGSPDNAHPQALAAAPLEKVAREVAAYIRQFRPQVVLTFDPIGGYRHPDHIASHNATIAGFKLASDPTCMLEGTECYASQRLFFHTFPHTLLKVAVQVMRLIGKDPSHFGRNRDIDMASVAKEDFPIHAVISIGSVQRKKEQASACHASQGGGAFSGPLRLVSRYLNAQEDFMQGWPENPPHHVRRDLFEDVDVER
jgi:LmbE family N-acetylglucosaminyl deacetylase